MRELGSPAGTRAVALLGPTNTGKTHRAVERMLEHRSGIIGLPLRLLAREVYERVTARIGESRVALLTGEEKRIPSRPDYWVCTTEAMPRTLDADFVAIDEIQLAGHRQRGHTFTEHLLHTRGVRETWFLGADTIRPLVEDLVPTAEIERLPRFSQLRYFGTASLGSLPPRTAVVAFSIAEVYELAERLRQQHGGTAVVLGALSPRARNAQVAMYESGEVDYMVATDAIGMGLNLDVDRVVFASLQKFDGRELRDLEAAELGQIAGRAGRYTRDGEFGVLRPLPGLSPRRAAAIEQHRFEPLRRLVWRNAALDFGSVPHLIESLRVKPRRSCLRLIEHAEDYEALVALARRPEIVAACRTEERVALLWDVCRIPDYRKLLVGSHLELLEQIFAQLCGPAGRIDTDWMARRIEHLDDVQGSIDGLIHRMSFIRTWTYITHQESWIENAAYWQERTRAIEDRQSDELHARLTERFVDRLGGRRIRSAPRRRRLPGAPAGPLQAASPTAAFHPFQSLANLALDDLAWQDDAEDPETWVEALVEAGHDAFAIASDGAITFDGRAVARFRRGPDALRPDVVVLERDDLGAGARRRMLRRLTAWTRDEVRRLGEGETPVDLDALSAAGRGLVYQVRQGLGSVDATEARSQLGQVTAEDRKSLSRSGLVIGPIGVFVRTSLDARARRHRAVLWSVFREQELPIDRLVAAPLAFRLDDDLEPEVYRRIGYVVRADWAVRIDAAHVLLAEVDERLRSGPAPIDASFGASLGLPWVDFAALLHALGFRSDDDGRWHRRSRRRRARGRSRRRP